jgi:apolipoprotein N-acyltransferase
MAVMDRKDLGLSLLAGALLFLSFPKFGHGWVVWFALIPLFFALRGKTPGKAFSIGGLAGVVANLGILYWVAGAVIRYGNLSAVAGYSALLLLVLAVSLYIALFAAVLAFMTGRGVPEILAAPPLWTIIEFGKSHLFSGFPWENLGYALHDNIPILQFADVAGVYGLSFLIVFVNAVLFDIFHLSRANRKRVSISIVFTALAVLLLFFYGHYRIEQVDRKGKEARALEAAIVQGSIEQAVKWNPAYQLRTLEVYETLSRKTLKEKTDLLVWPETAMPFFFQDGDEKQRRVRALARDNGVSLVAGSPSYREREGRIVYGNSAFLVSPDGTISGRYDKVHLVPFGEYVPLKRFFSFAERLVAGVGDFVPGNGFVPLPTEKGDRLGVMICYEGIFPEIGRAYKKAGADLLVNITNDGWYGRSSAPWQHLSMAVFRAVENRMYLVRAANTGVSAVVSPTGKIEARTGLFERTDLRGTVRIFSMETLYSRYGDFFVCFCLVFFVILFLYPRRRKTVHD